MEDTEALGVARTCSHSTGAFLHLPSSLPKPLCEDTALALREGAVPLLANVKAITSLRDR